MTTLRCALIKLAHEKPELRKHLVPLIRKEADFRDGLARMKNGDHLTLESSGVYVHVWFAEDVAQTDFGQRVPKSGEWQVIVSTSPDRLNMNPRGRELSRKEFRYADPRERVYAFSPLYDYIKRMFFRFRKV